MSHYLWLIDEGHGGMDNGVYTTSPQKGKQYSFDNGPTIYEGEINRIIGGKLKSHLNEEGIDFVVINDPIRDTSLGERVTRANQHYREERDNGRTAILLSIHSNALTKPHEISGPGQTDGNYNSVWTSKGQTRSDVIAEYFISAYKEIMPEFRTATQRSLDGDGDFEEDFTVVKRTAGPAIIVESLFFDNPPQAEFLLSNAGQEKIARVLLKGIKDCEQEKPI